MGHRRGSGMVLPIGAAMHHCKLCTHRTDSRFPLDDLHLPGRADKFLIRVIYLLPGGNNTIYMVYDMFPGLDLPVLYRSRTAPEKGRLGSR